MKSFFLHAEVEDDREMLASVLSRHFENDLFKHFAMTYIIRKILPELIYPTMLLLK